MNLFEKIQSQGHEQVVFCNNPQTGLRAVIALHSTVLGPAIGGIRIFPYASEQEAIDDVLRLSKAMTYKASLAGLNLGGGNAVIIGDSGVKSEALFRSFGRYIQSLNGRFIGGADMSTNVEDINNIHLETEWVLGSSVNKGGSGNPAPMTAFGVYHGIRACLEIVFGNPNVRGKKIAIQGVGAVGFEVARYLHEAGAKLLYYDISSRHLKRAMEHFPGTVIESSFYKTDCDVLAPCAVGGIINQRTIPRIQAPIIAGAANNQLEEESIDAQLLKEKGILYATDYAVNAGGLISVSAELTGHSKQKTLEDVANIFDSVKKIFNLSEQENISTVAAADKIAKNRIQSIATLAGFFL
ncbi:MAG: Glu/Leu/Phe/Val dehydrogenase dimerization domain-containing protein [Myxococcota bacterium]|nr:Glu/Leu/Phe/Val dehydrogenase dimerization domain-containing protein [Myxococcota bacterium]